MKILIATGNPHKLTEMKALLPVCNQNGEALEYISLREAAITLPEETGITLAENAMLKAAFAAKQSGLVSVSDDTGLEVAALGGRPGVYTARYAGPEADGAANNRKLLEELSGLPPEKRVACFRTVACLATPQGEVHYFEGRLDGYIGTEYRGQHGFGYDPIFLLAESQKALAELTETEKNAISHRGQAFRKLSDFLKNW